MGRLIWLKANGTSLKHQCNVRPWRIKHPLLKGDSIPEEKIEEIVGEYLANRTKENLDRAVLSFATIIRYLTGRVISAYHVVAQYEDDIVSVAFIEVMERLPKLETANNCCKFLSFKIIAAQTRYVNESISPVKMSVRTMYNRGGHHTPVKGLGAMKDSETPYEMNEDADIIDLFEALEALTLDEQTGHIYDYILDSTNWAKTIDEQAEELDISVRALCRHRARVLKHIVETR